MGGKIRVGQYKEIEGKSVVQEWSDLKCYRNLSLESHRFGAQRPK